MKNVLAAALWIFVASVPSLRADECPPLVPIGDQGVSVDVDARSEVLAKHIGSGDFGMNLMREVEAAYAGGRKGDFKPIYEAMIARTCQRIVADATLSETERSARVKKVLEKQAVPPAPPHD